MPSARTEHHALTTAPVIRPLLSEPDRDPTESRKCDPTEGSACGCGRAADSIRSAAGRHIGGGRINVTRPRQCAFLEKATDHDVEQVFVTDSSKFASTTARPDARVPGTSAPTAIPVAVQQKAPTATCSSATLVPEESAATSGKTILHTLEGDSCHAGRSRAPKWPNRRNRGRGIGTARNS